jgi:hypothetical protein
VKIEAILSFVRFVAGAGIRAILFALPVALVAKWCDVQPTWKSAAFTVFCIFWSSALFDERPTSGERDNQHAPERPKRTVVLLTPAEVAAEARKMARRG